MPSGRPAALSRKRASSATAIASGKPMPTNPPVATVSPERIKLAASRADLILPSRLVVGASGFEAVSRGIAASEGKMGR
jgi:hypothetical protein